MSFSLCPHASPALLRSGVRGISATVTKSSLVAPSRWYSAGVPSDKKLAPFTYRPLGLPSRPRSLASNHALAHIPRRTFFGPRVIRNYEELPRDYRDQVGLHFASKDLSDAEVAKVFGPDMNTAAANQLLRILHGRRVAGTLYDPAFSVHTAQYSEEEMEKALKYLRKMVRVQEELNAGLRAEDELAEIEQENAEAERAKEEKTQEKEPKEEGEAVVVKPDPVYGRSGLDEIRARNIAKRKAQEKILEEKRRAAEAEQGAKAGPVAKIIDDRGRAITNPKVAEYYEDAQSDLEEPPEMSHWQRILPSATAVALSIGAFAALAMVYEEPSDRYRLFREMSTAHATIATIIAINGLVYLAWRIPPLWRRLNRGWMLVVATVRPRMLFTAMFSHQNMGHMVVNMIPLWFVGSALHEELGRGDFLALYLSCGGLAYLGSLMFYTLMGRLDVATLGASGAVYGICSAYFWSHKDDGFRFLGLPKDGVHGSVFLAAISLLQVASLPMRHKTDVVSHVAGILAGILGITTIHWARGEDRKPGEKKVMDAVGDLPWWARSLLGYPRQAEQQEVATVDKALSRQR